MEHITFDFLLGFLLAVGLMVARAGTVVLLRFPGGKAARC